MTAAQVIERLKTWDPKETIELQLGEDEDNTRFIGVAELIERLSKLDPSSIITVPEWEDQE